MGGAVTAMDDVIGVHLEDDYYLGAQYEKCTHKPDHLGNLHSTYGAWSYSTVPREQFERWEAAGDAYGEMQAEVLAIREERRHRG